MIFVVGTVLSIYVPQWWEILLFNLQYSGSSLLRFVPILVLVFLWLCYLGYHLAQTRSQRLKLYARLTGSTLVCGLFFAAGAFVKDPWLSLTMFNNKPYVAAKQLPVYAGVEAELKQCQQLGFKLSCQLELHNLLQQPQQLEPLRDAYVIDHLSSQLDFTHYSVGEVRYKSRGYGAKDIVIPVGLTRQITLEFELSSDTLVQWLPYLSLQLQPQGHQAKNLHFSQIRVSSTN